MKKHKKIKELTNKQLVEFSGDHLYYEIDTLYGVTKTLVDGVKDPYIYNALLEAFVVHASNVLDFFYKPPFESDDAKAIHFVSDMKEWKAILPPQSKLFKTFNRKRNKEVMHLSYRRLDVQPKDKRWGSPGITAKIKKLVDLFLENTDPQKIHPGLYELKSENWDKSH